MLNNHAAYKYETTYKVPFGIIQCCTNCTVTLQYGAIKIRHYLRLIKSYISDKKLNILTQKLIIDNSTLEKHQLYNSVLYIKDWIQGI